MNEKANLPKVFTHLLGKITALFSLSVELLSRGAVYIYNRLHRV